MADRNDAMLLQKIIFMKSHHKIFITLLIFVAAIFSAALVYFFAMRVMSRQTGFAKSGVEKSQIEDEVVVTFAPVNPDNPAALPSGTVGGFTACERLDNLKACLNGKSSNLASIVNTKEASSGATIEDKCGNVLDQLLSIRIDSIKAGCIW